MNRLGPTGKVSKNLRWTTFPGRTGQKFWLNGSRPRTGWLILARHNKLSRKPADQYTAGGLDVKERKKIETHLILSFFQSVSISMYTQLIQPRLNLEIKTSSRQNLGPVGEKYSSLYDPASY